MKLEFEKSCWDERYTAGRDSGAGSRNPAVAHKVRLLENLPWISSVVEIGCGDFNFGRQLMEKFREGLSTPQGVALYDNMKNARIAYLPLLDQFMEAAARHTPLL